MKFVPSMELARHKWHQLLPKLGIDRSFLKNQHGPCPICGGRDRFRFDNRNGEGSWICNSCGAGDGFDLVMKATRKSFRDVSILVRTESIRIDPQPAMPIERDEEELKNRQRKLWLSSVPPRPNSPVDYYLKRRLNGEIFHSPSIREIRIGDRFAMVAKIATREAKAANLHLTWIDEVGQKANVSVQKQIMAGSLPSGSAIRLKPAAEVMGIAEGIETAISAHLLYDMPVWAAINANNMMKWIPPSEAKEIWIFGDRDDTFVGQASAFGLAQRLAKFYKVKVMIPDWPFKDWNDVLGVDEKK